jgi:hypothetical protein
VLLLTGCGSSEDEEQSTTAASTPTAGERIKLGL